MNTKPTTPLLVTLAPLAAIAPQIIIGGLIGGAIYLVLDSLFPVKKKPLGAVTVEANTEARKPTETTAFRQIPAEIPAAKPAPVSLASAPRVTVSPPAVPSVSKVSASVSAAIAIPKIVTQTPLSPPVKKKFVTRKDLATVFQRGARSLNRTAVVAALKKLGFGKTAAYAALTRDGRFASWLQFAPDGIISWTDGRHNRTRTKPESPFNSAGI